MKGSTKHNNIFFISFFSCSADSTNFSNAVVIVTSKENLFASESVSFNAFIVSFNITSVIPTANNYLLY